MKRFVVLMAILAIAGVAAAQPDHGGATLTNTYTTGPAYIHIYVQMKGVAFSIDNTTWDLGVVGPNYEEVSGMFTLQNDGGVRIDLTLSTYDTYAGAHPWTPIAGPVSIDGDYTTYPGDIEYYLEPYFTDVPSGAPVATDFTGDGLTATTMEPTADNYGANYSYATSTGLKIPAWVPTDPDYGDQVAIYLFFIAPGSAYDYDQHEIYMEINAELADD